MQTVSHLCEQLGRATLADALSVSRQAVSNAVTEGKFPAKWFKIIRSLCATKGIDCPDELFSFIDPPAVDVPPTEENAA